MHIPYKQFAATQLKNRLCDPLLQTNRLYTAQKSIEYTILQTLHLYADETLVNAENERRRRELFVENASKNKF